jgi:hypothetical protein
MLKSMQGVVRMIETVDDATRGRKRTLSTTSLDDLEPKEPREMEEDDADEYIPDKDEGAAEDEDEDVEMTDQQGDIIEVSTGGSCEIDESLTTIMDL